MVRWGGTSQDFGGESELQPDVADPKTYHWNVAHGQVTSSGSAVNNIE